MFKKQPSTSHPLRSSPRGAARAPNQDGHRGDDDIMPLPISRCAGAAARRRLEAPATDDGGVAKYEAHAAAVDAAADDAPDGGGAVTTSGKNSPH